MEEGRPAGKTDNTCGRIAKRKEINGKLLHADNETEKINLKRQ